MNIFENIHQILQQNQEAVFCCITDTKGSSPRKAGSKMLVFPDRKIIGTIGGGSIEFQAITDALETLKTGKPQKKYYYLEADLSMQCGGEVEIYFEPIIPKFNLYIFGAGHIGRVVAKYANDFGFKISMIDERQGIFNEFENSAYVSFNDNYFDCIEKLEFNSLTFSVILTHKHEFDEKILHVLTKKQHAYLGMIGSQRKVAEVKKRMLDQYGFSESEIQNIDMPMGIRFNAETPEEIALSIVAKLIDVKNNLTKE